MESNNEIREEIISQALETKEGKEALAEAMRVAIATAISQKLNYQSIGKKLFIIEEPRYIKSVENCPEYLK